MGKHATRAMQTALPDTLIARAQEAPKLVVMETLTDGDCLHALAEWALDDPAGFEALDPAMRQAGVMVKDINQLQRAIKSGMVQVLNERHNRWKSDQLDRTCMVSETMPDAPMADQLLVPAYYDIQDDGVFLLKADQHVTAGFQEVEELILPDPVLITGRARQQSDGEEFVELCWRRDHAWRRLTVSRGDMASSRQIVALARHGFPVTSRTAGDVVEYLAAFESANLSNLPETRLTAHLGWHDVKGNSCFLLGRDVLAAKATDDRFTITFRGADAGDEQIIEGFSKAGSFEAWRDGITPLKAYPRALMPLYGAFTPPLLKILGVPNFGMNLSAPSTSGKTSILLAAASPYGQPDALLRTWQATATSLERSFAILCDLPVFIDETKLASRKDMIGTILYLFHSGQGKGRGSKDGLRRSERFRGGMICTGEAPIASYSPDGGQHARVVEIWGLPFGRKDEATAGVIHRLVDTVSRNYGHAGPRWIKFILNHEADWPQWKEEYEVYRQQYIGFAKGKAVAIRMAAYYAAIDFTAMYVHEALELPWPYDAVMENLYDELVMESRQVDRARVALQQVYSWAQANESRFYGRHDSMPYGGYAGRWDVAQEWETLAFFPHQLEKLLSDFGFEHQAILRTWRDKGWLAVDEDASRFTRKVTVERNQCRMVVIDRQALEEVDRDE